MIHKNNAIILKRFNWGETSIIATFFSDGLGKMDGILKAGRVNKTRFRSSFDIFSHNEIVYYKKHSGLHLVVECFLKDNYQSIREDINTNITAQYFIRLIMALLPKEERSLEIFRLLLDALESLKKDKKNYEKIARLFELHLLSLCGFKPHIESCISCQNNKVNEARFSLSLGGLLCNKCFSKDTSAKKILNGTVASMVYIQNNEWPLSIKLRLDDKIQNELRFILKNFLAFHCFSLKAANKPREVRCAHSNSWAGSDRKSYRGISE